MRFFPRKCDTQPSRKALLVYISDDGCEARAQTAVTPHSKREDRCMPRYAFRFCDDTRLLWEEQHDCGSDEIAIELARAVGAKPATVVEVWAGERRVNDVRYEGTHQASAP